MREDQLVHDLMGLRDFVVAKTIEGYASLYGFVASLDMHTRIMGISLILAVAVILILAESIRNDWRGKYMTKKEARKKGDEELCDGVVSVIEKMVEGRKIDRKQADKYYWGLAKFLHLQDLRPGRYGLMLIPNKVVQEHIKDKLVAIQTSREWRKKAMNGSRPGASIPGDKPPKVAVPMNKLKSAMV